MRRQRQWVRGSVGLLLTLGACGGAVDRASSGPDASVDAGGDASLDASDAGVGMDAGADGPVLIAPPQDAASEAGATSDGGSCASGWSLHDGGCGDPATDPHNCGGCGVDCDGGACEQGACVALEAGVLATGQYDPVALAVDGDAVYWLDQGVQVGPGGKNPPTYAASQVLRCARSGCGNRPTVLATLPTPAPLSRVVPSSLTLDATSVYWTESAGVEVCAKGGCSCSPRTLTTENGATGVAVTSSAAYVTEYPNGLVKTCPLGGCGASPSVLFAGVVGPQGIAVDGTNVYVANENGRVVECALGGCGGAATTLWQGQTGSTQAATVGVAVDATRVYWTNGQPSNLGSVFQCDKASCGSTLVMLAGARSTPWAIAVDATNVYWAEQAGVFRCAIGGCGGAPTMVTASAGYVLALDDANVYYTTVGTTQTDWNIAVIPKP